MSLAGGVVTYRATAPRSRRVRSAAPTPVTSFLPPMPVASDVVLSDVSGATTLEMTQTDSSDLVRQLNEAAGSPLLWPWVLAASVVACVISPLLLLLGLPLALWVAWKDTVRRTVVAFYDVRDDDARRYQSLVDAFSGAQGCQGAWHVVAAGDITTPYQHKVNAGAATVVSRLPLGRTIDGPRHLRANVAVPTLSTPQRSLHLLPDRVLIRDGRRYADVPYSQLATNDAVQRFIEDGAVPSDSRVLDYTWRYVNKSGGPDRRFKDNRQLPVLEYGRLTLGSSNGYSAVLDFSTPRASTELRGALRAMVPSVPSPRPAASGVPNPPRPAPNAPRTPHPPAPAPASPVPTPQASESGRHRRPQTPIDLDALQPSPSPVPALRRRRLSADGRVSVVGESHYQASLARAARGAALGYDWDSLPPAPVLLVPEPENVHDANAVRVDVLVDGGSRCAGYLSREEAQRYQPQLLRLRAAGFVGTCSGRITGGGANSYGLYLHLADPRDVLIENLLDDREPLPADRDVTVTKEEHHQDVLAEFHMGSTTRVVASLRSSTVSSGKYAGQYGIEVVLDGRRVGELTAAMSSRYRDVIADAELRGGPVLCEAVVTHGSRGFQIDLRLPKAQGPAARSENTRGAVAAG